MTDYSGARWLKAAVLVPALLLAGCLQPLYGPLASGGNVADEMQAIEVVPINDRLGHYLGNELIFSLNGTGSKVTPRYKLFVTVRENVQTPLIDTVSGRASAATVVVNADYRLEPAAGGEPITRGTALVASSYDRNSQRYANIRAAREAETRDAKTLADQIRTRIAAALSARG